MMSKYSRWGWGLIFISALMVLGLGIYGYLAIGYAPSHAIYTGFQLFVMEVSFGPSEQIPLTLSIARICAPLVMATTAIRAAMLLLKSEISEWKRSRLHGHIVLCGLGRKGYELARQFRKNGDSVVVIEADENNNFITSCKLIGAHVLLGNAASKTLLKNAGTHRASGLFLMTGNDGINLSTLMKASELMSERKTNTPLAVWLHIKAFDISSFLRNNNILNNLCEKMKKEVLLPQNSVGIVVRFMWYGTYKQASGV